MAKFRRTTILESMFLDIASKQDRLILDDLYSRRAKGPATTFMLRKVRDAWRKMRGQETKRTLKINQGGVSRTLSY